MPCILKFDLYVYYTTQINAYITMITALCNSSLIIIMGRWRLGGEQLYSSTDGWAVFGMGPAKGVLMDVLQRQGSVVVQRSAGMPQVGGSIPGRVKQKMLKFEVLLLCLVLSIKELETDWPAQSQNNGLGWDITAYPWRDVSVG